MPKTAHIYVPSPSRENLEIGLDQGLWGWRRSALDRAGTRQAVQSLTEGDFLVLGHRGPNSRVAPGGWANATLQRVIVTQVSRPYFTDSTPVWPGDDYPERIGIDVLEEEQNVPGTALGTDAMEALRLSANKQGAAVLQPGIAAVAQLATCSRLFLSFRATRPWTTRAPTAPSPRYSSVGSRSSSARTCSVAPLRRPVPCAAVSCPPGLSAPPTSSGAARPAARSG